MRTLYCAVTAATALLTVAGAALTAPALLAQETGAGTSKTAANGPLDHPIDLDVHSANLYYALTLLFDQAKVGNYTLPELFRMREVSAHFSELPLRTALETLLKNSGYTYLLDREVLLVVPRTEQPAGDPLDSAPPAEVTIKSKRIYHVASSSMVHNAVDITTRLGGRILPAAVGSQGGGTGSRTRALGSSGFTGSTFNGGSGSFGSGIGGSGLFGGSGAAGGPAGSGLGSSGFGNGAGAGGNGRRPGGF